MAAFENFERLMACHLFNEWNAKYNEQFTTETATVFMETVVRLSRSNEHYTIKMYPTDVSIEKNFGFHAVTKQTYVHQIQNPNDTLATNIRTKVAIRVTWHHGENDEALITQMNCGTVKVCVPNIFSFKDDYKEFTPMGKFVLNKSNLNSCYIVIKGTKYVVGAEEGVVHNCPIYRKPHDNIVQSDIMSIDPVTGISSYLNLRIIRKVNGQVFGEVAININTLKVYMSVNLRAIFMALQIYTDEVIASYVSDDQDEVDFLMLLLHTPADTVEVENMRKARTMQELFEVIQSQVPVDLVDVYKQMNWSTFSVLFYNGILPHVATPNATVTKVEVFGKMVRESIRLWLGRREPNTRYQARKKVCTTPLQQMQKAVRCSLTSHMNRNISPMFTKMLEALSTQMSKSGIEKALSTYVTKIVNNLNNSERMINETILVRIQRGQSYDTEATTAGEMNRDIRSRGMDDKSHYDSVLSDEQIALRSRKELKTLTEHESKKRAPDPDTEGFFDHTYVPEAPASKACTTHQLTSGTSIMLGLEKPYALIAHITKKSWLVEYAHRRQLMDLNNYTVLINGVIIGISQNPVGDYLDLMEDKINQTINNTHSVVFDPDSHEIFVSTESGRLGTLVIVLDANNKMRLTENDLKASTKEEFQALMKTNKLTWITTSEMASVRLTFDLDRPGQFYIPNLWSISMSNSMYIALISKSDGIRRSISANQKKKVICLPKNGWERNPTKNQSMFLASNSPTFIPNISRKQVEGSMTTLLAFGYGVSAGDVEEDASEMNKQFCELGIGQCNQSSTFRIMLSKLESFINPNINGVGTTNQNQEYGLLNDYGWLNEGEYVKPGGVLAVTINSMSNNTRRHVWTEDRIGLVASVNYAVRGDQTRLLTIVVECTLEMVTGDKIWVGNVCKSIITQKPPIEMPMTEDGMTVAIMHSPLGVFKRFNLVPSNTMWHQGREAAQATKTGTKMKFMVDLSDKPGDDFVEKLLMEMKFFGHRTLINPRTGVVIRKQMPLGFISVARLNHIPSKKEHTKSANSLYTPINPKTQQIVAGKSSGGGFRFGHLERQAIHGLGDQVTLEEVLYKNSDGRQYPFCATCGSTLGVKYEFVQRINDFAPFCSGCGPYGNVGNFSTAHTSNIATEFMNTFNIHPRKVRRSAPPVTWASQK